MRVKSNFKDYYDSVQAMGQDQSLLYVRTPVEEELEKGYPFPTWYNWYSGSYPIVGYTRTIGFCGKIYPVLIMTEFGIEKGTICHTLEDVDAFMTTMDEAEQENYHGKRLPRRRLRGRVLRKDVEEFFKHYEEDRDKHSKLFIEHHSPIFVAKYSGRWKQDSTITWNACLRPLEFFRVFDTYRAFQETQMFMSNLAVPLKPIPEIPDKIMVGVKGFDKWSFRKEPKNKK